MLFEPQPADPVIGQDAFHLAPESPGMIVDQRMNQLVDDNVIHRFYWCHDQPPRKIQCAFCTARSPTRACGIDPDALKSKSLLRSKIIHAFGQDLSGPAAIPAFELQRGMLLSTLCQLETFIKYQGLFLFWYDL